MADSHQVLVDGQVEIKEGGDDEVDWYKESFRISLPRQDRSAITSKELVSLLVMESPQWTRLSRKLRW